LISQGHSADYLDRCTLFDLDLFQRRANERIRRSGPRFW